MSVERAEAMRAESVAEFQRRLDAGLFVHPVHGWRSPRGPNTIPGLARGVPCPVCKADNWMGTDARRCRECECRYKAAKREGRPTPARGRCSTFVDRRTRDEVLRGEPRVGRPNLRKERARDREIIRREYEFCFGTGASPQKIAAWARRYYE